ncbi:MAG: cyclase family protein [Promethearchaeota archaeon]
MKIIDLSLGIRDGMQTFPTPGYETPRIKISAKPEDDPLREYYETSEGMKASSLSVMVHSGTHIDAPDHLSYGKKLDEVSIETFIGDAIVIDMSNKGSGEVITLQDLENALEKIKREFEIDHINKVIIKTHWTSKKWGTPEYFKDSPYLSKEAAEWLVKKNFKLVGIDFQTDSSRVKGRPVHEALLGNDVCIIEYLTNTEELTKNKVKLYALPLKLMDTEAAPARVVAIEE